MKYKQKILELREKGYSYRKIQKELGCSKGTVSYHLGDNQKEAAKLRCQKRRKQIHPLARKLEFFLAIEKPKNKRIEKNIRLLYKKLWFFSKGEKMITLKEVTDKFGESPKCYLTGDSIDINQPKTYHFDHIIPKSRGGTSTINNLGICTKVANLSKTDMTLDEYILHCKKVLEHNGYQVTK